MNTILARLNALFAFSLSVTAAVAFACFLTTNFLDYSQKVDIDVNKVVIKNMEEFYVGDRHDLGHIIFTLKANFTPVFNWNCKELFLYLMAEYETPQNKLNQVVLWDHIINRGENPVVNIRKRSNKYYFFDDGAFLRGNKLQISLHWNIIPNAGYLWRVPGGGSITLDLPESYGTSRI
ncbi:unnamed protein product [Clavelina lepadiformis]|uniref:Signal peptidase complex subunit 3 n=1 Tax=Clavelina lepadiformis TaxID=159417 RepID=A0ABP0G2S5_CLALP